MRFSERLWNVAAVLIGLTMGASAGPVFWQLSGVTLNDGGTANGTFAFDPDAGTACISGLSPCGMYSNVDIVSTDGLARTGATYRFVCGTDVSSCNGLSPDSSEVLFLSSNAADQKGNSAIAFFFTGVGISPPAGLTDLGGVIDISNSSFSVGAVQEGACVNAACTGPDPNLPIRGSTAGFAIAPEPSTCVFFLTGLLAMAALRLRRRTA